MAVIGRRSLLIFAAVVLADAADNSPDPLSAVNRLTTALSDGDAEDAIDAFDKSCPDYEELAQCFVGLTGSFSISNEADVIEDTVNNKDATLTLDWTLDLRSLATEQTVRRRQQVKVDLVKRKNVWKIVRFSPVDLFNPQI